MTEIIHTYIWDIVRVWYDASWPRICPNCEKASKSPVCTHCGENKPYNETEVTDVPTVKILEMFDRKKKKELEDKLNGRQQ